MKVIRHLEKLRKIEREKYHPLIHKIHKEHGISKKTLFYIKEYGPHSHVAKTIIKESIKILLLASIISSLGGFAIEGIKTIFVSIIPLVILLPALNGMIGSFSTIISSRFCTMLHQGSVKKKLWKTKELRVLFAQIFLVATITAILSLVISYIISIFSGYSISTILFLKLLFVSILDVVLLTSILFLTAIFAGLFFFKKGEDPNNLLIPITTSIADFGNMIILSILVILVF